MERELTVKIAEAEKMRGAAAAEAEAVSARIADVDARAHAVASADASSKERVRVLAEKAEALAAAREELQRLAAEADSRAQDADARCSTAIEAERLSALAEKKASDAQQEAQRMQEVAAQDLQRSKDAALKERERASAAAAAASADVDRRTSELAVEMKKLEERRATIDELEKTTMAALSDEKKAVETAIANLESQKTAQAEAESELERKRREIADKAGLEVEKLELLAQLESLKSLRADELSKAELTRLELEKVTSTLAATKVAQSQLRQENEVLRHQAQYEETTSILAAQPWLKTTQVWNEWESLDSVLSIARRVSKDQSRAHEAARAARKTMQKIGTATSWELLPREIRAGLRAGVALGDKVREACADLHAALVRRFLRLCAFQKNLKDDQILHETLVALRAVASQEIVRRRSLVQAIFVSTYSSGADELNKIRDRPAPKYEDATDLFKLRHNHFDALKLRLPAAKARFAAAAARWATSQFRQYLFDKAAAFNNLSATASTRLDLCSGAAVSSAKAGVFFEDSPLVLRFEDHGDHGRYAPRAACVFDDPKSL
ncbi:MAG: hypothetical protein AAF368_04730, partial [Planctomycetota bacterium]